MTPGLFKITHLITGLGTGGAELSLASLLSHTDRNHYLPSVLCLGEETPLAETLRQQGVSVTCLGWKKGCFSFSGTYQLWRALRQASPDCLQTWLYHADFMGFLVGRLARVPRILWTLRCAEMDMKFYSISSRWVLKINSFLSRGVDGIICNSYAGQRVHKALGYAPPAWKVIPNSVDGNRFSPPTQPFPEASLPAGEKLPWGKVIIGIVGRLDPMKDYDTFFAAAHQVVSSSATVHFLIVGTGMKKETPQVAHWIQVYGLEDHVTCVGEQKNIPLWMGAMDLLCSSSRGEGFPNVVAEALACGLPCIVTHVGDSDRLVHPQWGEVVPPQDPSALAQALLSWALLSPEERRSRGAQGRAFVLATYGSQKMIRAYEEMWQGNPL